MASATLPKPGTKYGPCAKGCKHRDCAETRATATANCRFCVRPIGYDKPYVRARLSGAYAHETCLENAVDRNDARVGEF